MNVLADMLYRQFDIVEPMDFYREIFPDGELDAAGAMTKGKYTGIALEIDKSAPKDTQCIKRYTVTDELDEIDFLLHSKNFCVIAPISYVGKCRKSENARVLYALCVELDDLIVDKGLPTLINQWSDTVAWLPRPTFVVASGTGLHLYYLFEEGIPLYPNVIRELCKYKRELTTKLWNRNVTTAYEKIQQESVFQPFRMVGTLTKRGDRTEAFRTGPPVSVAYMNKFVSPSNTITKAYRSNLPLAKAKELYPDWYEARIVQQQPKKHWICKRALYDWWKNRIITEAAVGHRYYCMLMLAVYAIKCDIEQAELESDCWEVMTVFERLTTDPTNHFTEFDVLCALQIFEDKSMITYPVNSIAYKSALPIKKNTRHYRKRANHIKFMNNQREFKVGQGECTNGGRPPKKEIVEEWRKLNPAGSKAECIRATGLSKPTVYKWWDAAACTPL